MLGWEVIPRIPIGNFSVSPHGVGIAIGYFIGAMALARRARRTGFDEDHAWNAAVVGVLGAIVGARLAYIVGHSEQFQRPIEYLQIYRGGISLAGGLLGGFLAAYLYCRKKKLDFLRLADLGAVGLAIGVAVGRIGDLVIGDHLGRTTDGWWGWEYQGGELISPPPCDPAVYPSATGCIEPGMVVHQTALYDSVWSLVILVVLLGLERRPRAKGFLIFSWAALYSLGRIATDFTRVDKTWFGTGLTGSQLVAIAVVMLAVTFLVRSRRSDGLPARQVAGAGSEMDDDAPVVPVEGAPVVPVEEADEAAAGDAIEPATAEEPAVEVGEEPERAHGIADKADNEDELAVGQQPTDETGPAVEVPEQEATDSPERENEKAEPAAKSERPKES